jgi:hypothetical protein
VNKRRGVVDSLLDLKHLWPTDGLDPDAVNHARATDGNGHLPGDLVLLDEEEDESDQTEEEPNDAHHDSPRRRPVDADRDDTSCEKENAASNAAV